MTSLALAAAHPVRWRRALARAGARVTWRVVVATSAIAVAMQAWSLYETAFGASDASGTAVNVSSMIVNALIAFSIMFTTFVADEVVAMGAPRLPVYAVGVLVGSASGSFAQWLVHEALLRAPATIPGVQTRDLSAYAVFVFLEYLIWGTIGVWIYVQRHDEMSARARMNASRLQRAETQRLSLEAQLTALQAQVEPRFLLDMLACARDRYEVDAASGGAMLGALIAYLRTALPRLRDVSSDLGREVELVRAYLDVIREHLRDGLVFEAEVPDAIRGARLPAMLLLPLVHGIVVPRPQALSAPKRILVSARVVDDRVHLRIEHDANGVDFVIDDANLAGIRQRLQALYHGNATLAIPDGTTAIFEIPFEPAHGDHR